MSLNILIMAGGSGTRLWPMSRKSMPKQLQSLIGDKSLIQQTYERVRPLASDDHIFVGTVGTYVTEMQAQLPTLPKENFIVEPKLRNNAAAIGLAAIHLHKKDPESIMVCISSDHAVTEEENFHRALKDAEQIIQKYPDYLCTIGIKPTRPSTEFGYIQMDGLLEQVHGTEVFQVKRFIEKPDQKTAETFVAGWEYLWNAGYFVWRVDTLLALYQQFLPQTYKHLLAVEKAIDTADYEKVLDQEYDQMDEIAVDYGILEHAPHIAVVPADLGWSDVGTWSVLHDILTTMTGHHVVEKGHHIHHDTENSLIYGSEKLIATVGLRGIIVVDTPDVLFIADKAKAHEVKKLIEKLKEQNKNEYL